MVADLYNTIVRCPTAAEMCFGRAMRDPSFVVMPLSLLHVHCGEDLCRIV